MRSAAPDHHQPDGDAPGATDPAASDPAATDAAADGARGGADPSATQEPLHERVTRWLAAHRRGVAGGLAAATVAVLLAALDLGWGQVLVDGIADGSVYALVALGIALVYKSTGVLNFAQGELGTVPAFLVVIMLTGSVGGADIDRAAVSTPRLLGVALVAVVLGALLGAAINLLVVQRLARASRFTSLVATVGVFTLLAGAQLAVFGARSYAFPRVVEGAPCLEASGGECTRHLTLFGVRIIWQVIVVLGVLLVVSVLLAGLFRTRLGVALLAAAQEPFAASLHGVSPRAMSTLAWTAAGALGALAGLLGGGVFSSIQPGFMSTSFLVPAFTAAVLGGITSMVGAVLGGLVLGLVLNLANQAALSYDIGAVVPNAPVTASFVALLLVLLLRPRGLLGGAA